MGENRERSRRSARASDADIRVVIIEDHAILAETLATALRAAKGIDVAGVAMSGEDGRTLVLESKPDVALVDVALGDSDGIELVRTTRFESPTTRFVILTGSTQTELFPRAMAAGASGYLFKEMSLRDVVAAIGRAHAGEVVVPEGVAARLTGTRSPAAGLGSDLTPRELEVLALLSAGTDVRAISRSLGITWHTARSYIANVLTKLGAHTQLEAVATATRLGIVERA